MKAMAALTIMTMTLWALPAGAEEVAEEVQVDADVCRSLTAHQARDDVAYRPGVDASGNAVASADLESSGGLDLGADHEYSIPLTTLLGDYVDASAGTSLEPVGASEIGIGTVTMKNGEVYFNDRPLGSSQKHAIAEACRKMQEQDG